MSKQNKTGNKYIFYDVRAANHYETSLSAQQHVTVAGQYVRITIQYGHVRAQNMRGRHRLDAAPQYLS